MGKNALEVLRERGFIEWTSHAKELEELFDNEVVTAYVGFDPTADSLHVGHLIPVMGLSWLQRMGHRPVMIAGGGTGMIGDPSGKSKERNMLTIEQVRKNVDGIKEQLAYFVSFDCGDNSAILVNNYDWLSQISFLDFLRDVGKFFSVNYMIGKEHVRSRIEDPDKTLSFTEFSYTLLQAYDFHHLFNAYGCKVQMGGNDQQGNIVAGIELIRKWDGKEVYGSTNPLLLTSAGTKFGKTEEGAVWLDPARTSPFKFYQFWINTEDAGVDRLLKFFTYIPVEEIAEVMQRHLAAPEKREAQRVLAWECTKLVHGEKQAATAKRASEILFGASFEPTELDGDMLKALAGEVPCGNAALPCALVDALVQVGAVGSKGEAKRLISGGGVYVNGVRVESDSQELGMEDVLSGQYALVRIGKKKYQMIAKE